MVVDETLFSRTSDRFESKVVKGSMTTRMVPISIGFATSPTRTESVVDEDGTVLINFAPPVVGKAMDSIVARHIEEMIVSEDASDRYVADFHCHHPFPMALDKRCRAAIGDSSFDGNVDNRWRSEDEQRLRDR